MKTRFVSIGRVINYRNGFGDNPAAAYTLRSMKYRKTVLKLAISASRSRFSIGHCCFSIYDVVRVLYFCSRVFWSFYDVVLVRSQRVRFYTRSFIFVFAFAVARDYYWRTCRIHTINGPLQCTRKNAGVFHQPSRSVFNVQVGVSIS